MLLQQVSLSDRRYLIVVNPEAGKHISAERIDQIRQYFEANRVVYELVFTELIAHADAKVRQHFRSDYHTDLLVVGGDGSLNEAVNGLPHLQVPVSIIAAGTGNDFIKNLHTGVPFERQLYLSLFGTPQPIDLGICNKRLFLNGVGIGFDGRVVEEMLIGGKMLSGHAAYYYAVLKLIAAYKEINISLQCDDRPPQHAEVLSLVVANGTTFGGGFLITPNAKIDDGLLEICLIEKMSILRRMLNLGDLKSGKHVHLKEVSFLQAQSVRVHADEEMVAHIDGELIRGKFFDIALRAATLWVRK